MSEDSFENPWLAMEKRRSSVGQHGENSARQACAWATFVTTGWGEVQFPDCYDFDLTFAERPFVSHAYSVIRNSIAEEDEILVETRFPLAVGGVYGWKQNPHGFYTGAWCFAIVHTQSPYILTVEADPNYTIQHHYTFNGLGIKDLPDYTLDDV